MTIYSKFNIVYHLQKWMDSVPGQTFLNYAYSWGASVVILGTLFKLTRKAETSQLTLTRRRSTARRLKQRLHTTPACKAA